MTAELQRLSQLQYYQCFVAVAYWTVSMSSKAALKFWEEAITRLESLASTPVSSDTVATCAALIPVINAAVDAQADKYSEDNVRAFVKSKVSTMFLPGMLVVEHMLQSAEICASSQTFQQCMHSARELRLLVDLPFCQGDDRVAHLGMLVVISFHNVAWDDPQCSSRRPSSHTAALLSLALHVNPCIQQAALTKRWHRGIQQAVKASGLHKTSSPIVTIAQDDLHCIVGWLPSPNDAGAPAPCYCLLQGLEECCPGSHSCAQGVSLSPCQCHT